MSAAKQCSHPDGLLFSHWKTAALTFPIPSVCSETAEKNMSVRGGQAGEAHCTKTRKQRWWDVLTEGVSFSSDLSLSPCSKNSLVTNSATWKEGKDQWRAASPDCFIMNDLYPRNIRNCCKMSVTMPLKPRWSSAAQPQRCLLTMTEKEREMKWILTVWMVELGNVLGQLINSSIIDSSIIFYWTIIEWSTSGFSCRWKCV